MYTEEPRRRIDWGYLLRKIVVIVLIVLILFLIIWLVTKGIKNNKINNNYNNTTNIQENINNTTNDNLNNINLTNPETYSESFIINYMYFHDNARDYVEKNNLPSANNSVRYSLQELISKGVILPVNYGNSTCDTENSYVIVTNNDGKYVMTTTLICGKEIAKTTEELKCSGLCTECKKEKIEYEFKQAYKATETTYSCHSGYTKTGSGNSTKCVKDTSSVVNPTKNTTYTCPSGYTKTGSGDTTKCVKGTSNTVNATAKTTYSCEAGYTLSGTKCNKNLTNTIDATATYSCSVGTPNNNNMCPTTVASYKCSNGDLVNGKYCRIYTTGSYYESYTSYYGKTYNGCSYTGSSTTACTTCAGSTRTVYNYKCYKTTYNDVNAEAVNNTVYTTKASVTYTCPTNYTLSGTKCSATITDTKNATAKTTYSCTKGTLSGSSCIVSASSIVNPSINVSYDCPSGYTKNGLASTATCTKGDVKTVNPTKSSKTVTKYKTKWSSETSIKGWERTGKTRTVKAS